MPETAPQQEAAPDGGAELKEVSPKERAEAEAAAEAEIAELKAKGEAAEAQAKAEAQSAETLKDMAAAQVVAEGAQTPLEAAMQTLSGAEAHLQELGFDLDKPLKRPWFGAEKKKAYDDYMAASTQVDDLRSKGGGSGTGTSSASRQKARRATRGGPGPTSKVVGQ